MKQKSKSLSIFDSFMIALSGFALLFIVAPIISLIIKNSPQSYVQTVNDHEVMKSIFVTIGASMSATLFASIFGIPLAYMLSRKEFALKRVVNGLIDLPVVIPHSAAGIALLGLISKKSFIGSTASHFGLDFVGGFPGIVVAMAFVSIPFLINSVRDGFDLIPHRYELVAMDLGASRTRAFFTIALPMASRSIATGMVMMWARGMSEFGAVLIIAYFPTITPILIYNRFASYGLKYAAPVSALFVLICLSLFFVIRILSGRNKNA